MEVSAFRPYSLEQYPYRGENPQQRELASELKKKFKFTDSNDEFLENINKQLMTKERIRQTAAACLSSKNVKAKQKLYLKFIKLSAYCKAVAIASSNSASILVETGFSLSLRKLPRVQLKKARLAGAILDGTILTGANLKGANLAQASLNGTKLDNANLKNIKLRQPLQFKQDSAVLKIATSVDQAYLITCDEKTLYKWKLGTGKLIKKNSLTDLHPHLLVVDVDWIYLVYKKGIFEIRRLDSLNIHQQFQLPFKRPYAFIPKKNWLIAKTRASQTTKKISLWVLDSKKRDTFTKREESLEVFKKIGHTCFSKYAPFRMAVRLGTHIKLYSLPNFILLKKWKVPELYLEPILTQLTVLTDMQLTREGNSVLLALKDRVRKLSLHGKATDLFYASVTRYDGITNMQFLKSKYKLLYSVGNDYSVESDTIFIRDFKTSQTFSYEFRTTIDKILSLGNFIFFIDANRITCLKIRHLLANLENPLKFSITQVNFSSSSLRMIEGPNYREFDFTGKIIKSRKCADFEKSKFSQLPRKDPCTLSPETLIATPNLPKSL